MNQVTMRDLPLHVRVLGWLFVVGHAISLAIGLFVFTLLTGIGAASGDHEAQTILPVVGIAIGLLLAALAIPGLVAGYGLLKHRPWARVLAIVIGILGMVNFPVGTAIGLYTVWVLLQETANEYFLAPA